MEMLSVSVIAPTKARCAYSLKALKKILVYGTLLMFSAAVMSAVAAERQAPDIRGHWAENYIRTLLIRGVISGMPSGNFYPDEQISFSQFITIIVRANYGSVDPANDDWASGYMRKASELGIIGEHEITRTGPINRFDAAEIVNNVLTIINEEYVEEIYDINVSESFQDLRTSDYYRERFEADAAQLYVKGIAIGRPGPVFDGDAYLTRAEACVIVMKMIEPQRRSSPETS